VYGICSSSRPERFRLKASRTGLNRPSETHHRLGSGRSDADSGQFFASMRWTCGASRAGHRRVDPGRPYASETPSDGGFVISDPVRRPLSRRFEREGSGWVPAPTSLANISEMVLEILREQPMVARVWPEWRGHGELSDRGLAKARAGLRISVVPRCYWAKVKNARKVNPPAQPELKPYEPSSS
jgi:hypothetical protein